MNAFSEGFLDSVRLAFDLLLAPIRAVARTFRTFVHAHDAEGLIAQLDTRIEVVPSAERETRGPKAAAR